MQLDSHVYHFALVDLSLKGALIQLISPPDQPSSSPKSQTTSFSPGVSCNFILPLNGEEADIQAASEIVHSENGQLGIEFTLIDIDSISALRRLMELNNASPERLSEEIALLGITKNTSDLPY